MEKIIQEFNELSRLEKLYQQWEIKLADSLSLVQLEALAADIELTESSGPPYADPVHIPSLKVALLGTENIDYQKAKTATEQFLKYADYNLATMLKDLPATTAKSALPEKAEDLKPLAEKYQLRNLERLIS